MIPVKLMKEEKGLSEKELKEMCKRVFGKIEEAYGGQEGGVKAIKEAEALTKEMISKTNGNALMEHALIGLEEMVGKAETNFGRQMDLEKVGGKGKKQRKPLKGKSKNN